MNVIFKLGSAKQNLMQQDWPTTIQPEVGYLGREGGNVCESLHKLNKRGSVYIGVN